MKKLDFKRNVNVEKHENDEWTEIMQHSLFEGFEKKELFMFCLALGYKMKMPKDLKTKYGAVNIASINDKQKYLLTSFGFDVIGDEALTKISTIRSSAAEYAKGGFKILQKILTEDTNDLVTANELYRHILDLSKK